MNYYDELQEQKQFMRQLGYKDSELKLVVNIDFVIDCLGIFIEMSEVHVSFDSLVTLYGYRVSLTREPGIFLEVI